MRCRDRRQAMSQEFKSWKLQVADETGREVNKSFGKSRQDSSLQGLFFKKEKLLAPTMRYIGINGVHS